jgi:hypothetical protein
MPGIHLTMRRRFFRGDTPEDGEAEKCRCAGWRGACNGLTASRLAALALYPEGRRVAPITVGARLASALYAGGGTADAEVVLAALRCRGLLPWRHEEAVASHVANFSTKADILCLDSAGRLVVVEVKQCTGTTFCAERGSGTTMLPPLDHVTDTWANRACVQAWLVMLALRTEYGIPGDCLSWAVVVSRGALCPCVVLVPGAPGVPELPDLALGL